MNLQNATDFLAAYAMGRLNDNRSCVVLIAKATYVLPNDPAQPPQLSEEHMPISEADSYAGEPGLSACLYEHDFAPYKPRCDIILQGSAYAPNAQPAHYVDVRLQLNAVDKRFRVVGDRHWQSKGFGYAPSEPIPFERKTIHYGCAFGGTGQTDQNPDKPYSFADNPIGIGYFEHQRKEHILNQPLPNTEFIHQPVTDHRQQYTPLSFGPIARNVASRYPLAGTYDQHWIDHVSPLWPDDFDHRYHQCAPQDQQTSYLYGGERVRLENLTPEGITEFCIPYVDVPMMILNSDNEQEILPTALDTLIIEPDNQRFSLVWRAHRPLKVNLQEIDKAVIGKLSPAWWRAVQTGKTWNPHIHKNPFEHSA